ncbi:MAG: fatty acid desaturase [Polyangiales bacterium]
MEQVARTGKQLVAATRPFAVEDRAKSWFYVLSTLAIWLTLMTASALTPYWPAQLVLAVVAGLVTVRVFILYHDYLHGAILRNSKVADLIMKTYGLLILTPSRVWKQTHNYHHAHTAKIVGSHVGSYAMVTTKMWKELTPFQRVMYRITRNPLTVLFGYLTIFLYGMCTSSFLRNPKKNWDSLLSLAVHFALLAVLWRVGGLNMMFFGYMLPVAVATAAGAYLFYAQHNFEGVHIQPREEWNYERAALESSSYMKCGPVMNWFTGNIGYHHVHHLNPTIPFYRLPEAMAAIPELQNPSVTTLRPRDIAACFRLKLWDPDQQRMVGYRDAQAA